MKPLFSVVLISKNEEHTLPRLLDSLKEFRERGGEIIVLDTGSTDGTREYAADNGCDVYSYGHAFIRTITETMASLVNERFGFTGEPAILQPGDTLFDYSSARNSAASLATNNVVAMPDCDEAYTALDIDAVNAAILNGAEQLEYDFVFSHNPDGSPEITFKHSKFYDRRFLKWQGIIHEILVPMVSDPVEVERPGPNTILLEHWQNKQQDRSGYLRGLALDCYENPKNDRHWHYLGRELMWSGRPKAANAVFTQHATMGGWKVEAAQSIIYMGDIRMQEGADELALAMYHRAIFMDGSRREPWLRMSEYWMRKNDPGRCAAYAEAALTVPWSNYYANRKSDYRQKPHELLYWAYYWAGDKLRAKKHWEIARSYAPTDPKIQSDSQFFV